MSPMEEASLIQLLEQRLRFSKRIQQADAAVLIAITQELQPRVLLTRRSMQLSQHAGEVSFPGGKRDPSDTSNIVVALREAQEETALNPFDVKLLGDLPIQRARSGLSVKPIVGLIPAHVDLIAQPSEIDRIFFADLKALIEAPPLPYEVRLARQSIYFPSMQVESEIVWGLTARMLISLFQYGLGYQKNWPFLVNPPDFGLSKF
ncbi:MULTISPECIES: NUDIX hydrolase [Acinetobacter]|uniref:CoA pyrophosphatase n=3 Tax=Acinetobacter haemolyticus TaxID=29430 RepID=A0A1L6KQ03_ACIHA|nr:MULTISPECIES: CoA pyrophosphatase [Acinetobacter]APR71161.1 coenzyme A pyrophosphatase [Acinetobacter haemolyticus]ATZ66525.1 coenzyme A pyrophosphatase [Acinetobacter haemolyticus]EEH68062.1 hydrolase, NUDIX family [Acinetobacter sp. ATCC 27244]EFF83452.1 hydrolase, NUDIX family [Acinetobacter haemolyticus ATCC 19194]MBO3657772.1 CoA pyrophosphatase [Acinetobacter haemolyticus]